jgi:NitT/TauT family transport system substrate-binding protein
MAGKTIAPVLLLLMLLPLSCSRRAGQDAARVPDKLTLPSIPFLGNAPFFIAQEEGFFREQGLDVEFVNVTQSSDALTMLVEGGCDVYAGNVAAGLFNAIARGAEIRVVADKVQNSGPDDAYVAILARRSLVESGALADLKRLKGLRIRYQPATVAQYYIEALLEKAGVAPEDIQPLTTPNILLPDAFAHDAVDIAGVVEPWVTAVLDGGHAVIWKSVGEVLPNLQIGIIAFGPRLLKKEPDVGVRFITAYLKAVRQYRQGKTPRNLEILQKTTGLEMELLKRMNWARIREDGRPNLESLMDFQRWAKKRKFLDAEVESGRFWDPRFTDEANRILAASEKRSDGL